MEVLLRHFRPRRISYGKKPKDDDVKIHLKRRAATRMGKEMNRHDIKELTRIIQSNKAEFVERQSNRVTKWIVRDFFDEPAVVIYDKLRNLPVTVWPLNDDNNGGMDNV